MKIRDVFNKSLIEDTDLLEVNMSPGNLRKMAAAIPGALAGMEFEMIVPGAAGQDEDIDWEPDWDADESAVDFADIFRFFTEGDFGNSRRDVQSVIDDLQSRYEDYVMEKQSEDWQEVQEEEISTYIEGEADRDEMRKIALEDMGLEPEEIEAAIEAGDRAHSFSTDKEEKVRVKETPAYHHWADAEAAVDEMISEMVQTAIDTQDDNSQRAEENWRDGWEYPSERDFLQSEGLRNMRDVYDSDGGYNISWPYMMGQNNGGDSPTDVAAEFGQAISRPWNASDNYHGGKREPGKYVIEPDGSLEPDDPSSEGGLEFVSPPLPVDEMLSDLRKVIAWAKQRGCYTNESTGLHMNVSVPNFSREKLDFVKLALFIGDEYILKQFDRIGNTYAKSAISLIKSAATPEKVQQVMARMKEDLDTAASKIIHSGATSKYTSINTKDGYIEFRSPGGDWLNVNMDQLETTLLRFVVGMDIALDENKHKQEYVKKFYKMIAPSDDSTNTLQYFARYSAGELPKSALASFLRQAQLQRKVKREKGGRYWWNVRYNGQRIEVVASTEEEAKTTAIKEWGIENPEVFDRMTATVLRPYEPESKPRYEIFNLNTNNSIEDADGITNDREALIRLDDYIHHGPHRLQPFQARDMFGIRRVGGDGEPILAQPIRATVGAPQPAGSVGRDATSPTGQWKIIDGLGRELYRFRPAVNTRAKANELAAAWAQDGQFDGNYQVEPVGHNDTTPRPVPGVIDIEPDISPGSTTDLAQQRATPGTFTGAWKVLANGEEVYRFSGVGNAQSDANRVAVQWLRDNGYSNGDDVEVLPIMS